MLNQRLSLNSRVFKCPLIRNITGSTFLKNIVFVILVVQISIPVIIHCSHYMGYSISYPTIGYNFLYDQYFQSYDHKRNFMRFIVSSNTLGAPGLRGNFAIVKSCKVPNVCTIGGLHESTLLVCRAATGTWEYALKYQEVKIFMENK